MSARFFLYQLSTFFLDRIDMTANGVVKVADFGLAEDMYGTNYYRHRSIDGGERVPIRWMAPESIDTNIYNEATDVVSACRQQRSDCREVGEMANYQYMLFV